MKTNYRIRFNPVTKEIEVEGSESFVKAYFNKLQGMLDVSVKEKKGRAPKAGKAAPAKKAEKKAKPIKKVIPAKKTKKAPKAAKPAKPGAARKPKKAGEKVPAAKKVTNIDTVVGLIQASTEGISTAELKKDTGLDERQIWSVVNRASKEGKIRKLKRGVYGAVQIR